MTEPTKVYMGYHLGAGRWVGITEDHQWVMGEGSDNATIEPVGGWGKHPLATPTGMQMLLTLLNVDNEWRALTKPQRRCLMDPTTITVRPWRALTDKGLATADGLSARGMFLRLAREWCVRASQRAAERVA